VPLNWAYTVFPFSPAQLCASGTDYHRTSSHDYVASYPKFNTVHLRADPIICRVSPGDFLAPIRLRITIVLSPHCSAQCQAELPSRVRTSLTTSCPIFIMTVSATYDSVREPKCFCPHNVAIHGIPAVIEITSKAEETTQYKWC
jgi:hypothetical protein